MPSPNPWLITDLTPEVIKARDGSIRTIAAQKRRDDREQELHLLLIERNEQLTDSLDTKRDI
jgi:hypothetical protein